MDSFFKQTNVFMNPYQQPENKLTYSLLTLFEHLSPIIALNILERALNFSFSSHGPVDYVQVELLYGGGPTNPDGCIVIEFSDKTRARIFLENKTWRLDLTKEQIEGHIKEYLKTPECSLWVITTNKQDRNLLSQISCSKLHYSTWHDLVEILENTEKASISEADKFLLIQFVEYSEKSGEVWRARMIKSHIIDSYSKSISLIGDINTFFKESWALMDLIREKIIPKFPIQIKNGAMGKHWGRLGVECDLSNQKFGEWLFFGIYYDCGDHGISFCRPNQPEFAVFFDLEPRCWPILKSDSRLITEAKALASKGFVSNFPENECKNAWRFLYWHTPMIDYATNEVSAIESLFEEKLRLFFGSQFFQIFSSKEQGLIEK